MKTTKFDLTFDEKKQPSFRQSPQSKRRLQEKVHQRFLDVIELVDEGTQPVRQRRRHSGGLSATPRRLAWPDQSQIRLRKFKHSHTTYCVMVMVDWGQKRIGN